MSYWIFHHFESKPTSKEQRLVHVIFSFFFSVNRMVLLFIWYTDQVHCLMFADDLSDCTQATSCSELRLEKLNCTIIITNKSSWI